MDPEVIAELLAEATRRLHFRLPRRTSWSAPRGDRLPDGRWQYVLDERPVTDVTFPESEGREVEGLAVTYYRHIIGDIRITMAERGITIREMARNADLSLGVTTAALTGSSWPRWPTLEALASALGANLRAQSNFDAPVIPALLHLDRERAGRPIQHIMFERGYSDIDQLSDEQKLHAARKIELFPFQHSGRNTAYAMGVRKNTYYDLTKPGRSPSSSVVLALAAMNLERIRLVVP